MISKNKYDLIIRPIVTEKSTFFSKFGKYVFEVLPRANKLMVKKAIEEIFDVQVVSVNALNQKGKVKKFKNFLGRRSDTKKIIVTLGKDQTIDLAGGMK